MFTTGVILSMVLSGCSNRSESSSDASDSTYTECEVMPVEEVATDEWSSEWDHSAQGDVPSQEYQGGNGEGRTSHGAYSDYLEAGGEPIEDEYNPSDYYGD